jgi:FkbM family methyltransferase
MSVNDLVGKVMKVYRGSKFHNAKNGKMLMKLLHLWVTILPDKVVVKEIDNVKFNLDLNQEIDSSLYFSGTFEPLTESILERFIKPGMTTLDIGANIGYHTFRMARLAQPNGVVHAIEPTTWAIERLTKNSLLNPSLKNVKIHQIGFSDCHEGLVDSSFQSSYSLQGKDHLDFHEKILITCVDDFIDENRVKKVDFIKMDVDGFEGKIINGMKKTINRDHPIILFEITPSVLSSLGIEPQGFLMEFTRLNYSLYTDHLEAIPNINHFLDNHQGADSSMILAYPGSL